MQSEERFSFSFHLMLFFSADDKNIPKGICLPMTIRPDIFTHFANKPIQFYIAIFILKETIYNKCESKCLTKSTLDININIDLAFFPSKNRLNGGFCIFP